MKNPMPALSASMALAAMIALPAHAETKTYRLSGFDEVRVSAAMNVVLKQGPYSVTVAEPGGDFSKALIEVRGSTLVVTRKPQIGHDKSPDYTVVVTAPNYSGVSVSSASSVEGKDLKLKDVKVGLSSAGRATLRGSCGELELEVSSGSSFEGDMLKCASAKVDASSGAGAEAFASRSARGEASSGGRIVFHGKPAQVDKDVSSGGSVKLF